MVCGGAPGSSGQKSLSMKSIQKLLLSLLCESVASSRPFPDARLAGGLSIHLNAMSAMDAEGTKTSPCGGAAWPWVGAGACTEIFTG